MIINLIDGTAELFRHFYGRLSLYRGSPPTKEATVGVMSGVLDLLDQGETHIAVATDSVIESFRNRLWPGYKTSVGIDEVLLRQIRPLELALESMGVVVWPMDDFEADDALATGARLAVAHPGVERVDIWSPDKDLAQCVRGEKVIQADFKTGLKRRAKDVRQKFGVEPHLIPDFLSLVGDAADGYPGVKGIGAVGAARILNRYGPIECIPDEALKGMRDEAMFFRGLATLRTDVPLHPNMEGLRWQGPRSDFFQVALGLSAPSLHERCIRLHRRARTLGL